MFKIPINPHILLRDMTSKVILPIPSGFKNKPKPTIVEVKSFKPKGNK